MCIRDRHYAASDNALVTNREGTRHVLAFARAAGARMVYISTVSLGSEYVKSDPGLTREFSEDDFDIGQNWEDNVYLKGKFEAERLVREAAGGGLPVKILRIGRLVGRSSDGVFQKNPESNAFWGLVSGIVQAGMVPTELSDMVLDTTAVDECAAAALLLIQKGSGMVYHLFNPEMDSVREMIETMGANIVETSREQFEDRLRSLLAAGGSVSLSMLLSQYKMCIRDRGFMAGHRYSCGLLYIQSAGFRAGAYGFCRECASGIYASFCLYACREYSFERQWKGGRFRPAAAISQKL